MKCRNHCRILCNDGHFCAAVSFLQFSESFLRLAVRQVATDQMSEVAIYVGSSVAIRDALFSSAPEKMMLSLSKPNSRALPEAGHRL